MNNKLTFAYAVKISHENRVLSGVEFCEHCGHKTFGDSKIISHHENCAYTKALFFISKCNDKLSKAREIIDDQSFVTPNGNSYTCKQCSDTIFAIDKESAARYMSHGKGCAIRKARKIIKRYGDGINEEKI